MSITKKEFNTKDFREDFTHITLEYFDKRPEECTNLELLEVLTKYVCSLTSEIKADTSQRHIEQKSKKIYYFSMEFLIGPLLENYLINLGIRQFVEDGLSEFGQSLDDILKLDVDPGLGNGGLGRLAACFLDSMAALGIGGVGIGLMYRYGLFHQRIENGYQIEEPDSWLEQGYPWATAVPTDATEVHFGGRIERSYKDGRMYFSHVDYDTVLAVPYLIPIQGFGGKDCNALHLYSAQPATDSIDLQLFNQGDYSAAMKSRSEAFAITAVLYPNDNNEAGKKLRLKQEYFLVSAGLASIFRTYKKRFAGEDWKNFPDHVAIQTNDTHPSLIIPELMRRLMDDEGLEWDEAWDICTRTVGFTNHTVLPEALEKWPQGLIQSLLPRIYMIIDEIDRRWKESLPGEANAQRRKKTAILWGGEARMANLSIIGSHSVNGVAKIHSEILKKDLFHEFYEMSPEKFSNKTNGVSHRRFLIQANPELTKLINSRIGTSWQDNFDDIEKIKEYASDAQFLDMLCVVKRNNKMRLCEWVRENYHIDIDPDSVFDVHVKRIHAYKRQLLTAFKVLNLYNILKENPNFDIPKTTFFVGGKAAPGYEFAKETIKLICSIADIVNSDPEVSKKIKLIFIENYSLKNAGLIFPATDISEQISTAGKEASGTGNMKFMMNGAVTLGTMDGANIEIFERCGNENAEVFGLSAEEALGLTKSGLYNAKEEADNNPALQKITSQLIDGFFDQCGCSFWNIYDSLLKYNDEYFVLKDFPSYFEGWLRLVKKTENKEEWTKMSLSNIASSGFFSSDRTIKEYAKEVWNI